MTKRGIWPVRAMYTLVAVALVISLMITAAPPSAVLADAHDVTAEWHRIDTPSHDGLVLAPASTIIDYAVANAGQVAYAVVASDSHEAYFLLKSTDHAATWKDITHDDWEGYDLLKVVCDPDDPDFLAVAVEGASIAVFVSKDGGSTFDAIAGTIDLYEVYDFAVSPAVDDVRNLAIAGYGPENHLFRSKVTGSLGTGWEAADVDGWFPGQEAVVAVAFPLTWAIDGTVLAVSVTGDAAHLQSGHWGTNPGWNENAGFSPAVVLVENVLINWGWLGGFTAGITLPTDYEGTVVTKRESWVWVNYYDVLAVGAPAKGTIFWVSDADAIPVTQQIAGEPWLTNVSYWGDIASGKAMAGVLGTGDPYEELHTEPCQVVQVYRYLTVANMDICCPRWDRACKPPTGSLGMAAFYVSDTKAYAVALDDWWAYDESAWSFSYDNGDTWNQLSLIDTHISWLSDVAVSPNCNKTMLVSVNYGPEGEPNGEQSLCDSVWYKAETSTHAPEYSGHWLRTWSGQLTHPGREGFKHGILRLAPEETNGDTVYLVDLGTGRVYWDLSQTLGCWQTGTATVTDIVDLALKDARTPYVLGAGGDVAMSDDYGRTHRWQAKTASGVTNGFTIAVWGDDVLVGGKHNDVAHSSHGVGNFTALEKIALGTGHVTVAFDSYYGANDTIYAALGHSARNGIYLWVVGESTSWTDLDAEPYDYTGLVLDNADGNPRTSPATGGVLYASYVSGNTTGVARTLTPIVDILCADCTEWDYLTWTYENRHLNAESFSAVPHALKICGCLTADSYTRLFAIDRMGHYDMFEGLDGNVWRFIDCYSKQGPSLRTPADGSLIPSDACDCINQPFGIGWTRLCDACYYQIQFASDANFDNLVWTADDVLGSPALNPSYMVGRILLPGETYYWRVRAMGATEDQVIRSWWSDARSVTIAPALGTGVYLVAPEIGATGQPRTNIAFVWDSVAVFDSYNFVLSRNADFSAPDATATGLTTKAYTYTGANLAYDTPYYWRITAIQDGAPASVAIGTFRTMAEPPDPVEPPPVTTPFWVWVIIAIGAVLVIVVIVLIFRTRRV